MALLSFTVKNHKSIRDEVTLDLTRPSLKTLQPKDGNWAAAIYPLAGVFGANASGKSAILDALIYAFNAAHELLTVARCCCCGEVCTGGQGSFEGCAEMP